jgi:hypothetical protein
MGKRTAMPAHRGKPMEREQGSSLLDLLDKLYVGGMPASSQEAPNMEAIPQPPAGALTPPPPGPIAPPAPGAEAAVLEEEDPLGLPMPTAKGDEQMIPAGRRRGIGRQMGTL